MGPVIAAAYVLTLDSPTAAESSRAVGAFLGLRPRQSQSGDSDPQRRISKTGNEYLRRLLVQAAQYVLGPFGPDSQLRRWGLKLAGSGGKRGKKRAWWRWPANLRFCCTTCGEVGKTKDRFLI